MNPPTALAIILESRETGSQICSPRELLLGTISTAEKTRNGFSGRWTGIFEEHNGGIREYDKN